MSSLLLISNSTQHGRSYLDHCENAVRKFLRDIDRVVFVPYALADHSGYSDVVRRRLGQMGIGCEGLHESASPAATIQEAPAIFVGGGNSFRLLSRLYSLELVDLIRQRVEAGMRYMGSSAGTNMACPTIRTTNDMPIVEPPSLRALGLIPFQINPHYIDADPDSTHMGETRETRLREYLEENPGPVLALREGTWLRREGDRCSLGGERPARLLRRDAEAEELEPGADLSDLLRPERG